MRSIRSELVNAYIFKTLDEVREKTQQWKHDYNHKRPHKWGGVNTYVDLLSLVEKLTSVIKSHEPGEFLEIE